MRTLCFATILLTLLGNSRAAAQFLGGPRGAVVSTSATFSSRYSPGPFGLTVVSRQTTISSQSWGGFYSYSYGPLYLPPPPIIVVPQPVIVVQPVIVQVQANEGELPKAADPQQFKFARPDPPPARVEKKPKEIELGIEPAPFPLARGKAPNPLVEHDRQLISGREAFAKGEYGRALEHFRKATTLAPNEPAAWFLLAQAQFAVGKYDDAVASIIAGLERHPEWPVSRFHSRDLYKDRAADFDTHLRNLRKALATDPADPRLLFLLAVELWFDEQRDEARKMFEQAAKLTKDPAPANAFLSK